MAGIAWTLTLDEVLQATGGTCSYSGELEFSGVGTDTRKSLKGQLFIALKGDQFDGHNFVQQAAQANAAAIMVHAEAPNLASVKVPVIRVKDTLTALQNLANFWRRLNKFKVLGITGSNGKTSTKEFTRAILEEEFSVYASVSSFNNHWGVPFSLLAASPDTEIVVQEMGMNHSGELTQLVKIAEPQVVVCTMVGSSHIGELGSREALVAAKEEIYLNSPNALQIYNIDNQWTLAMYERAQARKLAQKPLTFSSFNPKADVHLRADKINDFKLSIIGRIGDVEGQAEVPVVGRHNVVNLMAASALALAVEMSPADIWRRLPFCRGSWGRNQVVHLPNGAVVLFDGYNANPESMTALIKNAYEFQVAGKKVCVLGAMMELGFESANSHRALGKLVAASGFDVVWFMGPNAADFRSGISEGKYTKKLFISDAYDEAIAKKVGALIEPNDIAVVKGSRAMKLEKVVQQWQPVDFSASY